MLPDEIRTGRESQFSIVIDFERGTHDPAHVFLAMAGLVSASQQLDQALLGWFGLGARIELSLEDVQVGSLRVILRRLVESIDEDALRQGDWKKVIGGYLVKARRVALNWLEEAPRNIGPAQLIGLDRRISRVALDEGQSSEPHFSMLLTGNVVKSLAEVQSALLLLSFKDKASFLDDGQETLINVNRNITARKLRLIAKIDGARHREELTLKIKKPDYTGDPKWEFILDGRVLKLRIRDQVWLRHFQNGEIEVRPGNSLRAIVAFTVGHNEAQEVVLTRGAIIEVLEVLRMTDDTPF